MYTISCPDFWSTKVLFSCESSVIGMTCGSQLDNLRKYGGNISLIMYNLVCKYTNFSFKNIIKFKNLQ